MDKNKDKAFEVIESISKKYFMQECDDSFGVPAGKAPFYDIFCAKGLTQQDYRLLGEALLTIAGEVRTTSEP